MLKNQKLFVVFIIFLLLFPLIVFGALDLETSYPQLPGTRQTIRADSSLGEVIKYFLGWAIILGALIAFGSLIYGGMLFLTSTGNPARLKDAKTRIFNSFFGLLVLLSSYLILTIINPQLVVMRIEKEPIELGVILLTEEGVAELEGGGADLESLFRQGKARSLIFNIKDAEEEFGNLIDGNTVTPGGKQVKIFEKFDLRGFGFFSTTEDKIKILTFSEKNFQGELNEYTYNNMDRDFGGLLRFKRLTFGDGFFENSSEVFPPLSIKKIGIGPGVYLYTQEGDQEYYLSSQKDLGPFNDKVFKIEIKNSEETDFLAILYEDRNPPSGQFRIFFVKRDWGRGTRGPAASSPEVGNLNNNQAIEVSVVDKYGKVTKASALEIYQLADFGDATVCEEVWLCTQPNFGGECLVYLSENKEIDLREDLWIAKDPKILPVAEPENLSQREVKKLDQTGNEQTKNVDFNDRIKSIKIKGDCLVALFDHSVVDPSQSGAGFWDRGGPGGNSQIFTQSIADLSGYQIHSCHPAFGFWVFNTKPCASAIAIYPLKK